MLYLEIAGKHPSQEGHGSLVCTFLHTGQVKRTMPRCNVVTGDVTLFTPLGMEHDLMQRSRAKIEEADGESEVRNVSRTSQGART